MKYKKELTILTISLLIFIIDTLCVYLIPNLSEYELKINLFIQNILSDIAIEIPKFITDFCYGNQMDYIILSVVILFLFFKYYRSLIVFFIALTTGHWLFIFAKLTIKRPRPSIEHRLIEVSNYSFPSGHSTMSMVLYGLLIYFTWKYVKNRTAKITLTSILTTLIVAVGFTRLWLGVHFVTDIIGGFSLGICIISIFAIIDKHFTNKDQSLIKTEKVEETES